MYENHDSNWLKALSRRMRWLEIPNIAAFFVALQIIGFLLLSGEPAWFERLALYPDKVLQGEVWRIASFLAIPLTGSLIGMLFALMFSYFILNSLEQEWGSSKTTLYVVVSIVLTTIFSIVFDYSITSVTGFAATWFLAAATLFPENRIQLYFFIPIKMKYLGWLAVVFIALQFIRSGWLERFYLLTLYANYLLFFGPYLSYRVKQWRRRREFRNKWR